MRFNYQHNQSKSTLPYGLTTYFTTDTQFPT